MGDELSLLFRLKGENAQLKSTIADTEVAVARLRQSFGPQLAQTLSSTNKVFSQTFADLSNHLNLFVGERLPLVGGAFVRITENLRGLEHQGKNTDKASASLAQSIESIATQSGKSVPQVASFLAKFIQIEGQANRNKAAFDFFGGSVDLIGNKTAKFIPELEQASTQLATVAEESASAGAGIAGIAGPVGIAILILAALTAAAIEAAHEVFELTKRSAEFQGKMFDLAQQTGLAVETLSALEVVAKTTGGELGTITQAVFNFQRKLDEAQDPLSKTAALFRKFNIDTSDTENSLRQTFAALARMPEGFAQTNAAAEFFGARGGKQVLAILKETNGNLDETIKRLRDLGILISEDDARAADQFNDQLALLEFQLRGLGAEAIPVLLDALKSLSAFLKENRDLFILLQGAIKTLAAPVSGLAQTVRALGVAAGIATFNLKPLAEFLKEIRENSDIPEIKIPGITSVPLPTAPDARQAAADAVAQADAVVAIVKRAVAGQNQALDELFQKGRIDREKQTDETIADNKKVLDADRDRIGKLLAQKEQEIKDLDQAQKNRGEIVRRDTDDYRKVNEEVAKLQQERLDKENEFKVASAALRAKAAKERADSDREQAQNSTSLLIAGLDKQIHAIEEANKRRARIEPATLPDLRERLQQERTDTATIQLLEQAKIEFRIKGLEQQKQIGQLTVEEQRRINAQIDQLNQEADRLAQEHADRRIEIALDEVRRFGEVTQLQIDAQTARADTALRVGQINDEARIASIKSLAGLRVKTEEQAAREILKIRLDAIDREQSAADIALEAVKARNEAELRAIRERRQSVEAELKKPGTFTDDAAALREQSALIKEQQALADAEIELAKKANAEKEKAEKDHTNKTRILNAERSAVQAEGDRDIDEKRKQDIENERRYAAALVSIRRQALDAQRDIARTVIDLMVLNFARRKDIIKAQAKADIDEESRRNKQAQDEIRALRRDVRESNRTKEEKLAAQLEIDELEETEAERHRLVLEEIRRRQRLDEKNAEPIGRIGLDLDNLKEFASIVENSIVPLGELLRETFLQVADAIGQTVANWVLLGETGPAVGRRLLAEALANLAKEASVNAIKELALGFATLFFNPAESAAHFTAAGLWAAIAGGSALIGRGVAGDLFKSKAAGAGASGSRTASQGPQQLNPITLNRNQPPQERVIVIQLKGDDSKLGSFITAHIIKDGKHAGPIRQFHADDGSY